MLFWPFTIIYVLLGLAIIAVELYGVFTKRSGDTITENWRFIDTHSPPWLKFLWRVFTAGILVWALLHFAGPWR
jgi:hypothetical protein